MHKFLTSLFLGTSLLLALTSCGGGGGGDGDSGSGPGTDACNLVGLPVARAAMRIINGTACGSLSSAPVVRIITYRASTNEYGACSGSMITSNAVLTAAHCFLNTPSSVAIAVGPTGSIKSYAASEWVLHPNFNETQQGAFDDVAIVFLNANLTLPTLPILTSQSVHSGDILAIYGYGKDDDSDPDLAELRSGEMQVSDVTPNHIVATFDGDGSNTCFGDSGGPIVADINGQPAIAGITSTGALESCGVGDVSLFTNIQSQSVIDFIRSEVPSFNTR